MMGAMGSHDMLIWWASNRVQKGGGGEQNEVWIQLEVRRYHDGVLGILNNFLPRTEASIQSSWIARRSTMSLPMLLTASIPVRDVTMSASEPGTAFSNLRIC